MVLRHVRNIVAYLVKEHLIDLLRNLVDSERTFFYQGIGQNMRGYNRRPKHLLRQSFYRRHFATCI